MGMPGQQLQHSYQEVYTEVLEYSVELFRVISQSGGPFAQPNVENVAPQDLTNLAHSVTGTLLGWNLIIISKSECCPYVEPFDSYSVADNFASFSHYIFAARHASSHELDRNSGREATGSQ